MSEQPDCYSLSTPKARKEHRCCECGGVIQVGEKYFSHNLVWEGTAATFKCCSDCEALRKKVDSWSKYAEDRTAMEMLHESVFEGGAEYALEFLEIKRKRGAPISDWMLKRECELKSLKGER